MHSSSAKIKEKARNSDRYSNVSPKLGALEFGGPVWSKLTYCHYTCHYTFLLLTLVEILAQTFGYDRSFAVSSSGRSGGLVIFWNDLIKLEVTGYSKYHIDTNISDLGPSPWMLTYVYGEAQVAKRYKTWDTLCSISGASTLPCVALDDFNEVLL